MIILFLATLLSVAAMSPANACELYEESECMLDVLEFDHAGDTSDEDQLECVDEVDELKKGDELFSGIHGFDVKKNLDVADIYGPPIYTV